MDGFIPIIRSGEFFTDTDPETQKEYLNLLSIAPASMVDPSAVFGVNGWRRRLGDSGADPALAKRMFDSEWEMMGPEERVQLVYGNMLDRFYTSRHEEDVDAESMSEARKVGAALTGGRGGPAEGYLAQSGPAEAARLLETQMFGAPPPPRGI